MAIGILLLITAGVLKAVGNSSTGTFACLAGSFFGLGFVLTAVNFLCSGKAYSPFRSDSSGDLIDREYCPLPFYFYTGVNLCLGIFLLVVTIRALCN
jgi:hypothetical protein